jgi:hypothetical protein
LGGKHGVENESAFVADLIVMGVREFLKDTVSAKQTEFAADDGGATTCPRFVRFSTVL